MAMPTWTRRAPFRSPRRLDGTDELCSTRVPDVKSRVQGSGSRVQGSGFRVYGSGFRVQGLGFKV